MLKILITGGSGFIGGSLKKFFNDIDEFHVFSPNSRDLDLSKSSSVDSYLTKNKFDVIIHTANHHYHPRDNESKDLNLQLEKNINMFFNIIRNAKSFKKLIHFGSGGEYPREKWHEKINEMDFLSEIPKDPYGLSKNIMNLFSQKYDNVYNLRLFGVFGELDNWRYRFIPNICVKAIFDKELVVNQNAIFDFLYIKDLCNITLKFVQNNYPGGDYNLCTAEALELKHIANIVKEVSKKDVEINIKNNDIQTKYGGTNKKLLNIVGKYNFTKIDIAIKNVYEYLYKNKKDIDISELSV